MQSHSDLDWHAVGALNFLRVTLYRLLHPQCGVAGADAVVLVRERCSEQSHDPVAPYRAGRALVALDGFHHPLQNRIEQLVRFLRIAIGD